MAANNYDPLEPTLEHAFDVEAEIADPIEVGDTGDGHRRIIPISGGTVSGRINGKVLPAGADYQLFRIDRPSKLIAKYAIETETGSTVYVQNRGIRVATSEVSERIRDGKEVDPEEVYFRSTPQFETADPDLKWLERNIFVCGGVRRPYGVKLSFYRVG
jgi:hypothetical protein